MDPIETIVRSLMVPKDVSIVPDTFLWQPHIPDSYGVPSFPITNNHIMHVINTSLPDALDPDIAYIAEPSTTSFNNALERFCQNLHDLHYDSIEDDQEFVIWHAYWMHTTVMIIFCDAGSYQCCVFSPDGMAPVIVPTGHLEQTIEWLKEYGIYQIIEARSQNEISSYMVAGEIYPILQPNTPPMRGNM